MVRGLSYYNGTILEIKSKELKQTVASGGSYLVNGIQSTGISFGLAALELLNRFEFDKDRYLIISINQDKKSIELSNKLRTNGKSCFVMFGKVGKAFEYADSNSIPYVILIGEDEVKKGKYKLRNMSTGKEKLVSEKDLVKLSSSS